MDAGHDAGAGIGKRRKALLTTRTGLRQESELAGNRAAVDVGVGASDPALLDGQDIAPLDVTPGAVGYEPLEPARTGERRARAPADGAAVALRGRLDDFELEVGERIEQLCEVPADPVGRDQLLLADETVDSARNPAVDSGVEVLVGERPEISFCYV